MVNKEQNNFFFSLQLKQSQFTNLNKNYDMIKSKTKYFVTSVYFPVKNKIDLKV